VNDDTASGAAGWTAGGQWCIVAADDDRLRIGTALSASGFGITVATWVVVVQLAQGGGAILDGRIVYWYRLTLGGGWDQTGRRGRIRLERPDEGVRERRFARVCRTSRDGGRWHFR
jgi:hypothetical protein